MEYKDQGNREFAAGRYSAACELYTRAIETDPTLVPAYSNRAACRIHMEQWQQGYADAKAGFELVEQGNGGNASAQKLLAVKLLWRMTLCMRHLGQDPLQTLQRGLDLDPQNTKLHEEKELYLAHQGRRVEVPVAVEETLPRAYRDSTPEPAKRMKSSDDMSVDESPELKPHNRSPRAPAFVKPPLPLTASGVITGTRSSSPAAYDFWYSLDPAAITRALSQIGLEPETLDYFLQMVVIRGGDKGREILQALKTCPRYSTALMMADDKLVRELGVN